MSIFNAPKKIQFDKCPRCDSDWRLISGRKQERDCLKCELSWYMDIGNPYLDMYVGQYGVEWHDDGTCSVWLKEGDGTIKINTALPYDITEEQIKLYLTFQ